MFSLMFLVLTYVVAFHMIALACDCPVISFRVPIPSCRWLLLEYTVDFSLVHLNLHFIQTERRVIAYNYRSCQSHHVIRLGNFQRR